MLKNKGQHLLMYGIGPLYVCVLIACTMAGIAVAGSGRLDSGHISSLQIPFLIIGIALIIIGGFFWFSAVFLAKVDDHIRNNSLATDDVYAWVRNPIYSTFLMACTAPS